MLWSCRWQGKDTQKCQSDHVTWALQRHKKTDKHKYTHTCKQTDIPPAAPHYSSFYFEEATLAKRSDTKIFITWSQYTITSLKRCIIPIVIFFFHFRFWKTWRSLLIYRHSLSLLYSAYVTSIISFTLLISIIWGFWGLLPYFSVNLSLFLYLSIPLQGYRRRLLHSEFPLSSA